MSADTGPTVAFATYYPFALDPFQQRACLSLDAGRDVLVAAPTGAGKTVVGEYAVHLALATGSKCFYTTPIKALSNQKYDDLRARYGERDVGLLTGDRSVNSEAPVVVMTTEVLRNMLYAGSTTLAGLASVVMDEVHYLADKERGPVWEEVIISLPPSVRLVSLSATVSNAEEFGAWLQTVRGATDVVVEERRPIPLWQHVMVGSALHDLFTDEAQERVNPELVRLARQSAALVKSGERRPSRGERRPRTSERHMTPRRFEVIERLERSGLLPAIVFIFSRAGCDAAVEQAVHAGVRLTTPDEAAEIDRATDGVAAGLAADDRAILDFQSWRTALRRGVAAHHAGLLPAYKQAVEHLFSRGLVKVIYATETLALGINMPARSVVLERLVKWNGEQHADVTPGEYTQLTGRAGRRGIDVEGHGVVTWHPGLDPVALAGLASTRTYPLRSSFRPSYNMAVNLVHQVGRARARRLLESSFAQFQTDRATVGEASRRARLEEAIAGYTEAMACERGDFASYADLRRQVSDSERALSRARKAERGAARDAEVLAWRPGDVLRIPAGRSRGLAVVLAPAAGHGRTANPLVLTEGRHVRRLAPADVRQTPTRLASIRLPRGFDAKSPAARRELVSSLRAAARPVEAGSGTPAMRGGKDPNTGTLDRADEIDRLRNTLRSHPCHDCPDREDHARWAERLWAARREHARLSTSLARRQGSIAASFDRVCAVLDDLGYLDGDAVTDDGQRLRGIFGELDLLAAESLRLDLWADLSPADLAACVSVLTFVSRGTDGGGAHQMPSGDARRALEGMLEVWEDLRAVESQRRVEYLREPDVAFARVAQRWASGHSLAAVLADGEETPGDFVRAMRQVVDMLDQVAGSSSPVVAATARRAVQAVRRGVVAYDVA